MRRIDALMPPFASQTVSASDLIEKEFFILDIKPVSTRWGDRYIYTVQVLDEVYSLFLGKTSWRERLFEVWQEDTETPIGPLTMVKEGRTYIFTDTQAVESE